MMTTTTTTPATTSNIIVDDDGLNKILASDDDGADDDDDMPSVGSVEMTVTCLEESESNRGTTTTTTTTGRQSTMITTTSIHYNDDQQRLHNQLFTTDDDERCRPTSSPVGSSVVQNSNSNSSSGTGSSGGPKKKKESSNNNNQFNRNNSRRNGGGRNRSSSTTTCTLSCITYEAATWFTFVAITMLAIVDRFTTNVWPRQSFIIGSGTAGTDPLTLIPGPWSVMAYDIIARISGRHAICCFNLLLVTRCKSFEYYLANSTFINRHLVDCTNITHANLRLHRWNAIALCVLTIVHVWSILFPCMFHGYSAQVLVGTFEWPLSERKPKGFKDVNVATETMSLQVDDVWRLIEMTLLLGILAPLSVRWLARRWHIGMPLHQFIMIAYFVDIVRRHTHPHSIIFNTPFFVMWMLDKIFQMYWKRSMQPPVYGIPLDNQYMVVVWDANTISRSGMDNGTIPASTTTNNHVAMMNTDMVGPDYYLRLNDSSLLEGRHVFAAFENRLGLRLEEMDSSSSKTKAAGSDSRTSNSCSSNSINKDKKAAAAAAAASWSAATVIRVFDNKRKPRLGAKDPISHTQRMFQKIIPNQQHQQQPQLDLNVWGPMPGEMSHHIKYTLLTLLSSGGGAAAAAAGPIVLVGAGSGIGYMLDALQYYYQSGAACCCTESQSSSSPLSSSTSSSAKRHNSNFAFKILFTTRSASLFRWVEQMVGKIVRHGECFVTDANGGGDDDENITNKNGPSSSNNNINSNKKKSAKIVLALTGTAAASAAKGTTTEHVDLEESNITTDISPRIVLSQQFGRLDFYDEIPIGSTVFCQGGAELKNCVKNACRVQRARWFFGQGGS
jgi:hypothetical protein